MKLNFLIDNRAGYTAGHIIKAFLLFKKPIGRNKLMKELYLNEASTRTLIKNLEKNKLIIPSVKGCILTKKGMVIFNYIKKNISGPYKLKKGKYGVSNFNIAYVFRKKANKIKLGLEQRDEAIRFGADGLTTLIYRKKLFAPGLPSHFIEGIEIKDLKNNDVVLIGSAKSQKIAEISTLNVIYKMM